MRGWRVAKSKRARDMTGKGAAIDGGRWNDVDVPAMYLGLSPAICCLETFVHLDASPTLPLVIIQFELPDNPDLYLTPNFEELPVGWAALPADSPSMAFGTKWLQSGSHLGLIVPSAVLPLENNVVLNPNHPAISLVKIIEVYDFTYDERMFKQRVEP